MAQQGIAYSQREIDAIMRQAIHNDTGLDPDDLELFWTQARRPNDPPHSVAVFRKDGRDLTTDDLTS